MQEKTSEERQIPVATPSRAQTMYWDKFKVAKNHYNPMLKSGSDPKTTPVVSSVAPPPADVAMVEATAPASTDATEVVAEAVAPPVPASTVALAEATEATEATEAVVDGGATGSTEESVRDEWPRCIYRRGAYRAYRLAGWEMVPGVW